MTMQKEWIRRPHPRRDASVRLFCLPHAGGTTSLFKAWVALLPPTVELLPVCLPGREGRLDEPFPKDITTLATQLADAMEPLLDRPWAVFGHSMGAVIAHEVALILDQRYDRRPEHLFVSAREAPQYHRGGSFHLLNDDEICAELVRLGGTPPDLIQNPEIRAVVLPAIRNDYRMIETYTPRQDKLMDNPMTVLLGSKDSELTVNEAIGWREWTTGNFDLRVFPGGHFYLLDDPRSVVDTIMELMPAHA